jgi:hypothetical protein
MRRSINIETRTADPKTITVPAPPPRMPDVPVIEAGECQVLLSAALNDLCPAFRYLEAVAMACACAADATAGKRAP